MHLVLSILSAGVIVSSLAANKGFGRSVDETFKTPQLVSDNSENPVKQERVITEEDGEDYVEDVDFDGDDFEDVSKGLLGSGTAASLMHIHQEDGEVLVPCFGMWWPMGGYTGGGYEYIDYYGDYRKKKRRSRKQKKAAKMRKKKS